MKKKRRIGLMLPEPSYDCHYCNLPVALCYRHTFFSHASCEGRRRQRENERKEDAEKRKKKKMLKIYCDDQVSEEQELTVTTSDSYSCTLFSSPLFMLLSSSPSPSTPSDSLCSLTSVPRLLYPHNHTRLSDLMILTLRLSAPSLFFP